MNERSEYATDFKRHSKTAEVLVSVTAAVLLLMGHTVWCDCGILAPWSEDI